MNRPGLGLNNGTEGKLHDKIGWIIFLGATHCVASPGSVRL